MSLPPRIPTLLATIASTPPRAWGFAARAWLVAPSVELALRTAGIKRTLNWLEMLPSSATGHVQMAENTPVEEGTRMVRWACKLQPLTRNACLTRSLVQYALHRRDGVPARFIIGVRMTDDAPGPVGLDAHAWVEPLSETGADAEFAQAQNVEKAGGFSELLRRESFRP